MKEKLEKLLSELKEERDEYKNIMEYLATKNHQNSHHYNRGKFNSLSSCIVRLEKILKANEQN